MKSILESELILNKDGSVYHLNLLPSDVADIIITVGDPERVERVASFFDSVRIKKKNREFETITGFYKGKEITVISTGIGTSNIDIVMNELDALKNINLAKRLHNDILTQLTIIRLGTSGSIQKDIPVNSLVVSKAAMEFDSLFNFYPESARFQSAWSIELKPFSNGIKPICFDAHSSLLENFKSLGFVGITATMNGFYAPQGREIRIGNNAANWLTELSDFKMGENRFTNIEMETSAIYGFAHLLGHQAISISAILANRITGEFSNRSAQVIDEMIKRSLDIISERL